MGASGHIAHFFLRSELTPLIAIAALLAGVVALVLIPREEDPHVDVTIVDILIPFPGAAAKDVETLVTTPAERLLSRIEGVDHIASVTRAGAAQISVQFLIGEDPTRALVSLYDTINTNRDWLDPSLGVGEPLIKRRSIDDISILTLTLWTKEMHKGAYDIAQVARSLVPEIQRIEGTRDVHVLGGPRRAVRVLIDPQRLQAHELTVLDLQSMLQLAGRSRVIGTLLRDQRELIVKTGAPFESARDLADLVVAVRDGRPVLLSEVASVVDGPEQPDSYVLYGQGAAGTPRSAETGDAHPAVTIAVSKMRGVNAVSLSPLILNRIEQLHGVLIPDSVEIAVTRDYGKNASDKARLLISKLIFITLLVTGLALVALGWREAIVIGLAVSLTLVVTVFATWGTGFTLNRISLFALIFSVGFLVDDAIVVVENVHRWRARHPQDNPLSLIPKAVDEVGSPTILATFTVIVAVLPMAFIPGLAGSFLRQLPIIAAVGMFLSLVIAFVITPWLSLRFTSRHGDAGTAAAPPSGRLQLAFGRLTQRTIEALIHEERGRRRRRLLYLGVALAIAAALALPASKLVLLKLLGTDNQSEFAIVVDMPPDTPVEQTANVLLEVAKTLRDVPEVVDYVIYAGTPAPINLLGLVRQYYLRESPELGMIQVKLLDHQHRARQSHQIVGAIRGQIERTARAHGGDARIAEPPPGVPVISPIVAEIYGPDYEGQKAVARFVRSTFESTPDIVDISDSLGEGATQLNLRLRQDKAALLGVSQTAIADALRMGLTGSRITWLNQAAESNAVVIQASLPPSSTGSILNLLDLRVRSENGARVPLSELVEVQEQARDDAIYHKDLLPVVYVFADQSGAVDSPVYGMFDIRDRLRQLAPEEVSLPDGQLHDSLLHVPQDIYGGYSIKWGGDWEVTLETFGNFGAAYLIGVGFIYLLLVGQFKSYLTPLVVMAPIPLTIIGVLPGHLLFDIRFTAASVVGMAALAGIMVRNSILLVQFIDEQVASGVPLRDAVIESTIARTRPIALAALAAMLGGVLLLNDPLFGGLAVSLLFGVFASTALTLLLLPPLYYGLLQRRFRRGDLTPLESLR
ncbi:MAG: efflux RND transporter permease subunit [Pseudomonadota bacterium]|nr:efflux RND transporter permease subunit [Pseudomonadota bacterium]